jgi:aryl-alcohol dehydrogenase-like predicted oxidoreductase
VVKAVAAEQERTVAEVALAWVMARRGVASTLIGARSVGQLQGNLSAADLRLTADQMARLDAVSAPAPGFSASLTQPAIRRMVFGGHEVRGWAE